MNYAVARIKGRQFKVSEGDEILIDKLSEKKVEADVLLVVKDDKVKVGKPKVKGAKVSLKILGEEKAKKLHISTYKAKSRYRRKIGFRHQYTRLKVGKIVS